MENSSNMIELFIKREGERKKQVELKTCSGKEKEKLTQKEEKEEYSDKENDNIQLLLFRGGNDNIQLLLFLNCLSTLIAMWTISYSYT